MDGLIQIQVVVQGNAGAIGLAGLVRRAFGSTITRALLHKMDKDRRASVTHSEISTRGSSTDSRDQGGQPMIRLGRRASLLVALWLLTSAAITAASPGTVEQSSVTVTPG